MRSILSNRLPRHCVQRAAPALGPCSPTQHSTSAVHRLWIRKTGAQTLRVRTAAVACEAVNEDVGRQRKAFKFKKFQVYHDKCSHKVGTDGCLLGGWVAQHVTVPSGANILDVGTGSGVIALMLAQAFEDASITGVDIDNSSYEQAVENFHQSPFSHHLHARHSSLQDHTASVPAASYSLLVSNPPYYIQGRSARSPHGNRAPARQNYLLPFRDLLTCSAKLLADHGLLCVILPPIEAAAFIHEAQTLNTFSLVHMVRVRTRQQDGRKGDMDKRHILLLQRQAREWGPESGHGAGAVRADLGEVARGEHCWAVVERPCSGAAGTAAVAGAGVEGNATGTVVTAGSTGVTAVGSTVGMVVTAGSTGVTAAGSTAGTVVTAGSTGVTAVGSTAGTVVTAGSTGVTAVGSTAGTVVTAGSTGVTAAGSTAGTVVTPDTAGVTAAGSTTGTAVGTAGPTRYTAGDQILQTSSTASLIYIHSQGMDYSPEFEAILKEYLIIF